MERRNFIGAFATVAGTLATGQLVANENKLNPSFDGKTSTLEADLIVAGGGLGGIATALAALRNGLTVVLTEETDWIGGQITSQGVPPQGTRDSFSASSLQVTCHHKSSETF